MPKITDTDLLNFFVGQQYITSIEWRDSDVFLWIRMPGIDAELLATTVGRTIERCALRDIKEVVTGVLQIPPLADRLLWMLWKRESVFDLDRLKVSDKLSFVQSVFADIDDETVEVAFGTLLQKKYIQPMTVDCRESDMPSERGLTNVYALTPEGKEIAKSIFRKLNDGTFAYVESPQIVSGIGIVDTSLVVDKRLPEPIGEPLAKTLTQSKLPSNHERDHRIYDLSFDLNLTWGMIASIINGEFGEQMSPDATAAAAKRHQKSNKLQSFPERKPGRKPNVQPE